MPRVPFDFGGAGGSVIRAWRVSMNSNLSVAILFYQQMKVVRKEQFKFLVDFSFFLEDFEGRCDAMETVVKST